MWIGASVGSAAFADRGHVCNTQRTFLSNTSLNNRRFAGLMDDVQIYGTALTAAQVQALAAGNAALTVATPAAAVSNPVTGNTTSLSALGR